MKCKECGSYAINEHMHGRRKGRKSDHCDVCYWRTEAFALRKALSSVHSMLAPLPDVAARALVDNPGREDAAILLATEEEYQNTPFKVASRPFKQAINLSK